MKWSQEVIFPTNPDLADTLGDTDFAFENFHFGKLFGDCKFTDFQTPTPPDKLSDPNLTPLPTHPGIKYIARSPCCDKAVKYANACENTLCSWSFVFFVLFFVVLSEFLEIRRGFRNDSEAYAFYLS